MKIILKLVNLTIDKMYTFYCKATVENTVKV